MIKLYLLSANLFSHSWYRGIGSEPESCLGYSFCSAFSNGWRCFGWSWGEDLHLISFILFWENFEPQSSPYVYLISGSISQGLIFSLGEEWGGAGDQEGSNQQGTHWCPALSLRGWALACSYLQEGILAILVGLQQVHAPALMFRNETAKQVSFILQSAL